VRKEKHLEEEVDEDEEVIYKIEIPANRYMFDVYVMMHM
jgi:phenylalanyl-tRNA synthetase beta chain